MIMKSILDNFFYPESIAVIGASSRPKSIGYEIDSELADIAERTIRESELENRASVVRGDLFQAEPKRLHLGGATEWGRPPTGSGPACTAPVLRLGREKDRHQSHEVLDCRRSALALAQSAWRWPAT